MGQRHQVFLIARVRPKHGDPAYRCIAAFHHQWCYGSLPLRAMNRFLQLVTQPENAAILSAELREMDGKYGRTPEDGSPMPAVPCPYGGSLLATAWTTDLPDTTSMANSVTTLPPGSSRFDGVTLRHGLLDAKMGCWDGDNNDGISIIDVTNPLWPAYCFMKDSYPLSAYEYLQAYYNVRGTIDPDQTILFSHNIVRLCGIPLLEAHVLKEAWPRERFEPRQLEQDHVAVPRGYVLLSDSKYIIQAASIAIQRLMDDPDDDEPRKWDASVESAGLSPMSDVTTRLKLNTYLLRHPFVFNFQFVSTPLSSSLVDGVLELLSKTDVNNASDEVLAALKFAREDIRDSLRQLSGSPFPEDHLNSLLKLMAITGDHFADLSGYDLSAAQIIRFASRCLGMDSLDISQNPHIVLSDIPTIFIAAPHLRRLNVCGCDAIDGQALLDLVRTQPSLFLTAEAIIHPAFLTITKPHDFPIAFTFMCACEKDINGVSLPLFTPTQVLQALCQILPPVWHSSESQLTRLGADPASPDFTSTPRQKFLWSDLSSFPQTDVPGSLVSSSSMLAFAVFSSGSRRPGQSWFGRAVVGVPLHPYPSVSPSPEGSWAFYFDSSRIETSGYTTWTFIYYGHDDDMDAGDKPGLISFEIRPGFKRRGKAYDLRGFLRCMAEQGRPLPPEELVEQLECLLHSQHGGQLVCQPTPDADVPTALATIPSMPLYGSLSDEIEDAMIRRTYAMESEVHPFLRYWTEPDLRAVA